MEKTRKVKKKLVILGIDHGHYKKIIEAAKKRDDVGLSAIAHETDNSAMRVAKSIMLNYMILMKNVWHKKNRILQELRCLTELVGNGSLNVSNKKLQLLPTSRFVIE